MSPTTALPTRPRSTATAPALPAPRGPLTSGLFERLAGRPGPLPPVGELQDRPLTDDDLQLALYCCYELHYRGFAGVDDAWEWEPGLLAWRSRLEAAFESALREAVGPVGGDDVEGQLHAMAGGDGPSLSSYLLERGSLDQLREFVVHRSPYQLKEADPHTWGIPRLAGPAKAAMVELQSDEYGGGVPADMHSTLFAGTMAALGLDPTYGRYLELVPGSTLATTNVITLFGLHRRLRGAVVGHLALFEMTSVQPMGRYSRALERHGFGPDARRFYDVHVVADEVHQVIAVRDLVGQLVADDPAVAADVVFGAAAAVVVESGLTDSMLDAWAVGRSSLRGPIT